MSEDICEVVLLGVDGTALQGMLDQPARADRGVLLLHAKGGSRHDRALKKEAQALSEAGVAYLIPELVDESEGWHEFGDESFFAHRAEAVLLWWHQRAPHLQLSAFSLLEGPLAKERLLSHGILSEVVQGQ